MAKCDLCGGVTPASNMSELRSDYRTPDVADLCKPCERWVSDEIHKMYKAIGPSIQAIITERKGNGKPLTWYQRVGIVLRKAIDK